MWLNTIVCVVMALYKLGRFSSDSGSCQSGIADFSYFRCQFLIDWCAMRQNCCNVLSGRPFISFFSYLSSNDSSRSWRPVTCLEGALGDTLGLSSVCRYGYETLNLSFSDRLRRPWASWTKAHILGYYDALRAAR